MSKYTTTLRFVCETFAGLTESTGYANINQVINGSRAKIFDFDYPIFDENYRPVLEAKILRHYYMREIGLETVSLWKLFLEQKMTEIMPYYNQLYKSELLEFNPLYDTDLHTVSDRKEDNTRNENYTGKQDVTNNTTQDTQTDSTVDATNDTLTAVSNTPQGQLEDLKTLKYLSEATDVTDTGKTTSNANATAKTDSTSNTNVNNTTDVKVNNLNNYIENVIGKRGGESYSKMLMEFRDTFLNIDVMILNELSELFMNIY